MLKVLLNNPVLLHERKVGRLARTNKESKYPMGKIINQLSNWFNPIINFKSIISDSLISA